MNIATRGPRARCVSTVGADDDCRGRNEHEILENISWARAAVISEVEKGSSLLRRDEEGCPCNVYGVRNVHTRGCPKNHGLRVLEWKAIHNLPGTAIRHC